MYIETAWYIGCRYFYTRNINNDKELINHCNGEAYLILKDD